MPPDYMTLRRSRGANPNLQHVSYYISDCLYINFKEGYSQSNLPKFNNVLNNIKKVILATINSGIWQVNQVLTLTVDYAKG